MPELTGEKPVEKIKDAAQQAANAETTSAPQRRYRTELFQWTLIVITCSFTALMILVKLTPMLAVDIQITRAIQSINSLVFAAFMELISWPGFPPQSFIIPVLLALLIYFIGLHWEALVILVAALFPAVVNLLVKDFIQRPRPTMDLVHVFRILNSYSFPSGHVMFYVGFFGFICFLIFTLMKKSIKRTLLLVFFGSWVVFVGLSRIYLGQHWASDVLGAYLLGSLTLVVIIQFYRWGKKRFLVNQPVAPEKPKSS